MSEWLEDAFDITTEDGKQSVTGFISRGVGLYCPDAMAPDDWIITHLASGMRIGRICAERDRLFVIATALATAVNWESFETADGWESALPDLPQALGDTWLAFQAELEIPGLPWSDVSPTEVEFML